MKNKAILFVMSHLSDAQELMTFNDKAYLEQANDRINFAKYLMLQLNGDLQREIDPEIYWAEFCQKMNLTHYNLQHKISVQTAGLRFTTSRPMALAMTGEPLVVPRERGDLVNLPNPNAAPRIKVYIHGKAERLAGYDIPIFIDGDLEEIYKLDKANITMLLPNEDGNAIEEHACITTTMGSAIDNNYKTYYLILK